MSKRTGTPEEWAKRVERWASGGLTAREYAAEIGVNHHTLSYWKYRLARRPARRDGIELARSTMREWHQRLADLAAPVVAAMRQDAFKQPYLCTDATGVLVQTKEKCRTGHYWVLVAPKMHVLFEFTRRHDGDAVDDVLAGYEGLSRVADAHVVYDHLYRRGDVVEVNCWAHARRYFFRGTRSSNRVADQRG